MSDKQTVATVHEIAKSAHKRLDSHGAELVLLREAKHKHAGMLNNHNGILSVLPDSMADLKRSIDTQGAKTEKNTSAIQDFKTMMKTGLWVGGTLGSFIAGLLSYIGGNIVGLW